MTDEECLERHYGHGQPLEVVHASIAAGMYHFSTRDSGLKNTGLVLHAVVRGPQQFYDPTREALKYAIDALNAPATKYRLCGLARPKRSYSNASPAIDIYLNAKRNASGEPLSKDNLSE
jgi:hypothetical protein